MAFQKLFCGLILSLLVIGCAGPNEISNLNDDGNIRISNVNIVDVEKKRIVANQDIVIEDGRITAISNHRQQSHSSKTFEANGMFVVPGLYDAHVHIDTTSRLELMLPELFGEEISSEEIDDDLVPFMAYGITGIVVLEGNESVLKARERSREPGKFAPRILSASPILDGSDASNPTHFKISSPAEAVKFVDDASDAKYDLIKIYGGLNKHIRDAVITRASELGLPVSGHLPTSMSLEDSIVSGFSNVAHAEEITRNWDGEDPDYLANAVSLMKKFNVSFTPNLSAYREIFDEITDIDATIAGSDWKLTPPLARVYATPPFNGYVNDFGGSDTRERAAAHFKRLALVMDKITFDAHKSGILILAGSDTGNPTMFAGQTLFRELNLLRGTGLDGYDVLATSTINVAKFFGEEKERGSVDVGKVADLVLFKVNPVRQRYLQRSDLFAVIKDGYLFDQEHIAREVAGVSARYDEREMRYFDAAIAKRDRD